MATAKKTAPKKAAPRKTAAAKKAAASARRVAEDLAERDARWVAEQAAADDPAASDTVRDMRAEVAAEADVPDDVVTVPLGPDKRLVHVLPPGRWRSSANNAMQTGDFEGWAELCLTPGSYEVWCDVDPTLDEVMDMFAAVRRLTGQDVGKQSMSRRSLMGTRRR